MPEPEERLISPLAIRFTQDRIHGDFADGRALDDTLGEMSIVPSCVRGADGTTQQSRIIVAPFPHIVVYRLKIKPNEDDAIWKSLGGRNSVRYVTFDNRRLCCLQRIAAAQLPLACVAAVKVHGATGLQAKFAAARGTGFKVHVGSQQIWDWVEELKRRVQSPVQHCIIQQIQADIERPNSSLAHAPPDADPDSIRRWYQTRDEQYNALVAQQLTVHQQQQQAQLAHALQLHAIQQQRAEQLANPRSGISMPVAPGMPVAPAQIQHQIQVQQEMLRVQQAQQQAIQQMQQMRDAQHLQQLQQQQLQGKQQQQQQEQQEQQQQHQQQQLSQQRTLALPQAAVTLQQTQPTLRPS